MTKVITLSLLLLSFTLSVGAQAPPPIANPLTITAEMGGTYAGGTVLATLITPNGNGTPSATSFFNGSGNLVMLLPQGGNWQIDFCNTTGVCWRASQSLITNFDVTTTLTAAINTGQVISGTQYAIPAFAIAGLGTSLGSTNCAISSNLNNLTCAGYGAFGASAPAPSGTAQGFYGTMQAEAGCVTQGTGKNFLFIGGSTTLVPEWTHDSVACQPLAVQNYAVVFSSVSVTGLTSGNCVQAGTNGLLTTTSGACGSGGSAPTLQTNGTNNSSQTTLNLINSAVTNGLTLTLTNTGAGTVQLGLSGTLNVGGLTNNSTNIGGVSCTLGNSAGTCFPSDTTTSTGTSAISANTCTSTTNVTMTGATTAMVPIFAPTSDVSGVTGWGSSGGLVITAYVSSVNTVSYKVCNQTSSSITPGASVTWNIAVR